MNHSRVCEIEEIDILPGDLLFNKFMVISVQRVNKAKTATWLMSDELKLLQVNFYVGHKVQVVRP